MVGCERNPEGWGFENGWQFRYGFPLKDQVQKTDLNTCEDSVPKSFLRSIAPAMPLSLILNFDQIGSFLIGKVKRRWGFVLYQTKFCANRAWLLILP